MKAGSEPRVCKAQRVLAQLCDLFDELGYEGLAAVWETALRNCERKTSTSYYVKNLNSSSATVSISSTAHLA